MEIHWFIGGEGVVNAVNHRSMVNIQSPFSPDPLKIVFLPVSSITLIILDGGSVPFILTICDSSENKVSWMPALVAISIAMVGETQFVLGRGRLWGI